MVERKAGLNVQQDREYLTAESESYERLVTAGFHPQGCTKDFEQVVVFEFLDGHQHGRKMVNYYRNWQEAVDALIK